MESLIGRLRGLQALAKLVGDAPAFLKAIRRLPAVAKSDAAVLITGETGTGKELVARAIHYLSKRAPFPFVPVNCGSLPDTLLEAELFGHERGAFTDARTQRRGLIAEAENGTLFLDEVDSLSPKGAVAVLRVLQDKRFRPVGSSSEQQVDVRIVAATNTKLDQRMATEAFRADLYYRLSVFTINLPPLRQRKEDVLPLTDHFLKKHAPVDRGTPRLSEAAREALVAYDWPGNVRELENGIIRAIHLSEGEFVEAGDLGIPHGRGRAGTNSVGSRESRTLRGRKQEIIAGFERDYLTSLMREHRGNVTHAALAAGKERRELGKLLKKYEIDPQHFRLT